MKYIKSKSITKIKCYFLLAVKVLFIGSATVAYSTPVITTPKGFVQVYPSTSTAWVIPGYHDDSYDSMGYPISTKAELIDWELNHADIAFGSNYDKSVASKIVNLGYMYTQKIDFSPSSVEFGLRAYAISVNENFEDYSFIFLKILLFKLWNLNILHLHH